MKQTGHKELISRSVKSSDHSIVVARTRKKNKKKVHYRFYCMGTMVTLLLEQKWKKTSGFAHKQQHVWRGNNRCVDTRGEKKTNRVSSILFHSVRRRYMGQRRIDKQFAPLRYFVTHREPF